ncbi:MAG: nucleoside deaminase [Elusimicrobia bacterium]|nr:nucleoside deaminase [Elusimicrobiota bacterium]MDE2313013.1 nucleoside deaminase [Elusimicrobiota bacterium]
MEPVNDEDFMREAIKEARLGLSEGGIPIGSVLVQDGAVVGRGRNRRVQEQDPTAHAEIDCLRRAGRLGSYRGATLYSTLSPCYLCSGAAAQFNIPRVVAGEAKNFAGAPEFLRGRGIEILILNDAECIELMREFIAKNPKLWNEDIGR